MTLRALDAGEDVLEKVAVQLPPHLFVDQTAPETIPFLEALLRLPLDLIEVGLEEPIQGVSQEDS